MPDINPLTNNQIFLKKIAENTGSDYETGDVSEINPLTIDQILLKEIAANTAGQSGDITELEGKVADNTAAIGAVVNVTGSCNLFKPYRDTSKTDGDVTWTVNSDSTIRATGTNSGASWKDFRLYGAVNDLKPVSGLFPCAGTYKISCEGADTGTYNIGFTIMDGSSVVISEAVPPSGKEYTITDAMMSMTCRIEISIAPGLPTSFDVTFKPMLYDTRLKPTGYVPYAMTNRELTDEVEELSERAYKYKDFSFTKLESTGLADFTAHAIIGAQVRNPSNLPNASHIPIFYNYGGITSNWNVRWLDRGDGSMITTPIEVSFTLRVYYIP